MGGNAELLNVKAGGTDNYHRALKGLIYMIVSTFAHKMSSFIRFRLHFNCSVSSDLSPYFSYAFLYVFIFREVISLWSL